MKRKYLLIAMYRAMDYIFDEMKQQPEELVLFLSDLNPYIWKERITADPALQKEFDNSMDKQNIGAEVDEFTAYSAVKNFLAEQYPIFVELDKNNSSYKKSSSFVDLFEKISLEEWKKFCEIVTAEEEN